MDRLTYLPDDMIREIYKFLDFKDVLRLTLVSKGGRWKELWLSCPYLNFDYTGRGILPSRLDAKLDRSFRKMVNSGLFDKRRPCIDSLSLQYTHLCKPRVVQKWMDQAMALSVKVLKLSFLKMSDNYLPTLCLKMIELEFVEVGFLGGAEPKDELYLVCPDLISLLFDECFHIEKFGFYGGEDQYRAIRICAPKLRKLHISVMTKFCQNYVLEKFDSLEMANIDIYGDYELDLTDMFRGLVRAKSLELNEEMLRVSWTVPISLNGVDTFENLRYLKLKGWRLCGCGIASILRLLEKAPNLKTLVLGGPDPFEAEISEEDLEAESLSWCTRCHVQNIELQCHKLSENTYKFLNFLLKNAKLKDVLLTLKW